MTMYIVTFFKLECCITIFVRLLSQLVITVARQKSTPFKQQNTLIVFSWTQLFFYAKIKFTVFIFGNYKKLCRIVAKFLASSLNPNEKSSLLNTVTKKIRPKHTKLKTYLGIGSRRKKGTSCHKGNSTQPRDENAWPGIMNVLHLEGKGKKEDPRQASRTNNSAQSPLLIHYFARRAMYENRRDGANLLTAVACDILLFD